MKLVCSVCKADLKIATVLGAPPDQVDCPACGARLCWDSKSQGFRLLKPEPEVELRGPTPFSPRGRGAPPGPLPRESVIRARAAEPSAAPSASGAGPSREARDSVPATAHEESLVGKTIGGCEIIQSIGRGGMGAVYRARQLSLDRIVAFKVIGESIRRDEGLLRRFEREAKTIAKFNSSRVVQVHEVGFDQGTHFISMEFVPGGDLKARTRERGRIPPDEAVGYIRQAAEGLLAAERQKIIHRDLKPENLMLDAAGEVKITDFGLAKTLQADRTLTQMGDYLGTPVYMSPEQAQGFTLDHRSDMYSLGATFFFLITGSPPYTGETIYEILRKKTEYECLDPQAALEGESFPEGIREIIRRMTALLPKDRYPSFQDLIHDIDRYLQGKRVGSGTASAWPLKLVALLLLGAGLLGGAYYLGWLDPWLWPPGGAPGAATSAAAVKGAPPGPAPLDPPPVDPDSQPPPPPEPAAPRASPRGYFEGELEKLRQRRNACGDLVLHSDVQKLLASWPRGEHQDLEAELKAISKDAQHFLSTREELSKLPDLKTVAPPFGELAVHWMAIRERLEPPAAAGADLKRCLEEEAAMLGEELMQRAEAAARSAAQHLEASRDQFREWKLPTAELEKRVGDLEGSRRTLLAAFPGGRGRWDEAIPEAKLAELRREIARRGEVEGESAALLASIRRLEDLFKPLTGLSDWTGGGSGKVTEELKRIETGFDVLRRKEPRVPLAEHEKGLQAARALEKRWTERAGVFARALVSIEARRLSEAGRLLDELRQDRLEDQDSRRLEGARAALLEGFQALERDLDLEAARGKFEGARASLEALGAKASYPAACLKRLEELKPRVEGQMAAVRAGRVRVRGGEPDDVPGFFVDRFEASIERYLTFVEEMEKVKLFDEVRHLWPDEETFRQFRGQPRYLVNEGNYNLQWPVEVNYHQARAFLRSRGKELFTVREWWLAAKGTVDSTLKYPSLDYNRSGARVPVGQGGLAARFPRSDSSVHHLSGNVAEWTLAKEGDDRTEVVGGSYRDTNERLFAGEAADEVYLSDSRRGRGFRGVIRPRDCFRDLLPEG